MLRFTVLINLQYLHRTSLHCRTHVQNIPCEKKKYSQHFNFLPLGRLPLAPLAHAGVEAREPRGSGGVQEGLGECGALVGNHGLLGDDAELLGQQACRGGGTAERGR